MYCIEPTVFVTSAIALCGPLFTYLAYLYWFDTEDIATEKKGIVKEDRSSSEDMVEIPPKYIHFHKLISALTTEYLPNWCKEKYITWTDLIGDICEWMKNEKHLNYYDFDVSIKILLNSMDDDGKLAEDAMEKLEYQQAFLWISSAIRMWELDPRAYMPHAWFVIDNDVYDDESEEDTAAATDTASKD